ncbi:hypothetical protein SG34_031920 [Thalassomonas viridans]|uniref:Uncharacterized protein n=1 Tax=Thalassomonas viridans TaxID=137584 RepID=A0AAF0CAG0_9GAMM|nr:hypothetical protein [Thalassomonas viridans]WDE08532.1 hypothetical protein SG34_031920 [Thalassomonas viridans]
MKTINLADNIYRYAADLLKANKLEGQKVEDIQVGDYVYEAILTFDPIRLTANKEKKYQVTAIERDEGKYGQDLYQLSNGKYLDRISALKAD